MLAFTKVLFEQPYGRNVGNTVLRPEEAEETKKILATRNLYGKNVANTVLRPEEAAERAKQEVAPAAPVANVARQETVPVAPVTKGDPEHQQNMRKTFNALPNRGRDLHIAGTGQKNPVNPEHQATFDAKFKQVAAGNRDLNPAGVPGVAPVKAAVKAVQPADQEMSGWDATKHAVKKGAEATGEAVSSAGRAVVSGVKDAAGQLADHPVAAALTAGAGAAGALGLRRILRGKNK